MRRKKRIDARFKRVHIDKLQRRQSRTDPRSRSPVWDLYRDGVTFTFLSNFLVDRERTRLNYVEGLTPVGRMASPLEFGELFHLCLENAASGFPEDPFKLIANYERQRRISESLDPDELVELARMCGVVAVTFDAYYKKWFKLDANKSYVFREQVFDVPYKIPTGAVIRLRGRWDAVFEEPGKDGQIELWLMENKTKGEIDPDYIQTTLHMDLQTMLYVFTLQKFLNRPVHGVLYNVVRRSQLRQGRSESLAAFLDRLKSDIEQRPDWYFYRWKVHILQEDVERWRRQVLDPLLEQVVMWWESIKSDPFDPWTDSEGKVNPHHFLRPLGVYDPIAAGRFGEYFDVLIRGVRSGYTVRKEPFPELVD